MDQLLHCMEGIHFINDLKFLLQGCSVHALNIISKTHPQVCNYKKAWWK